MNGHRAAWPWLVRTVRTLEEEGRLDRVVALVRPVADRLVAEPRRAGLLQGMPIGHALHPLLTDLPIGAWTNANLLDLVGGRRSRPAARTLVGFGIVTAVPTAVTGLAEWAGAPSREQRVGVVHAGTNVAALACYGWSYLARRRGNHTSGAVWALVGSTVATAGGYLGGHLSAARKVGSRHPVYDVT